jgi:hypothetical protein
MRGFHLKRKSRDKDRLPSREKKWDEPSKGIKCTQVKGSKRSKGKAYSTVELRVTLTQKRDLTLHL